MLYTLEAWLFFLIRSSFQGVTHIVRIPMETPIKSCHFGEHGDACFQNIVFPMISSIYRKRDLYDAFIRAGLTVSCRVRTFSNRTARLGHVESIIDDSRLISAPTRKFRPAPVN